jgi:hypothetical protein
MIQKGRCQNSAVVGTFAMAHVVEYDELPDAGSFANDEKPIGALILAHPPSGTYCFCTSSPLKN